MALDQQMAKAASADTVGQETGGFYIHQAVQVLQNGRANGCFGNNTIHNGEIPTRLV